MSGIRFKIQASYVRSSTASHACDAWNTSTYYEALGNFYSIGWILAFPEGNTRLLKSSVQTHRVLWMAEYETHVLGYDDIKDRRGVDGELGHRFWGNVGVPQPNDVVHAACHQDVELVAKVVAQDSLQQRKKMYGQFIIMEVVTSFYP